KATQTDAEKKALADYEKECAAYNAQVNRYVGSEPGKPLVGPKFAAYVTTIQVPEGTPVFLNQKSSWPDATSHQRNVYYVGKSRKLKVDKATGAFIRPSIGVGWRVR